MREFSAAPRPCLRTRRAEALRLLGDEGTDMKELKTKRLRITPMTDDELAAQAVAEPDERVKLAYAEMLEGCRTNPGERLWYTEWRVDLRETGEPVGGLGFKGPATNGEVEIGYGIDEAHRGKGYATEAAKVLVEWALSQEPVYFVTAETTPDNAASKRVLEKLGFSPTGTNGEEGPRFEKERPATSWMSVYLCLGMSVGLALGTANDNTGIGMSLGMCLGVALGASLDSADKKRRAAIYAARTGTPREQK